MKFTECLNDCWDYFFLGDPSTLSKFKTENDLSFDLIHDFTSSDSGDKVAEEGVLIPLSGVANYPYHIYFSINSNESVFEDKTNDLQFRKKGYWLKVTSGEVYLMTLPYLRNWTEEGGIKKLVSNGMRPKVQIENGVYRVEILGGEVYEEGGWEPSYEFVLKKEEKEKLHFDVEDVNFLFTIRSKEY